MDPQNASDRNVAPIVADASSQLTKAKSSLTRLREKLGQHPELDDAIERVEMALAILTSNSGGML